MDASTLAGGSPDPVPVRGGPDARRAARELDLIRDVIARTRRHVDPHAFHYVHWGAIVLVWYPVSNALQNAGRLREMAAVGVAAVVLGFVLSAVREARLGKARRLAGEDVGLARRVGYVVLANVVAGFVLSGLAPATGFVEGENVPIVWGLVYANLAFTTGLIYERDFLVAGAAIFAGTVVAMLFPRFNGYILGPVMGLGMIVPGLRAEARVRRLLSGQVGDAADETADEGGRSGDV